MKGGIFLSYRRGDTAGYAGRLYDRLKSRFPGCVFMDVGEIPPGTDFVNAINARLSECKVMIALIGRDWNTPRTDKSIDFVHLEIASALVRGVRVIPVLLRGAVMPVATELPPDLSSLSTRQALEITDQDWDFGCERLTAIIAQELGVPQRPVGRLVKWAVAAVLAVGLAVAGWWWYGQRRQSEQYVMSPGIQPPATDPSLISAIQRHEQSLAGALDVITSTFDKEVTRKIAEGDNPQPASVSPGAFPIGVWQTQFRDKSGDTVWIKISSDGNFAERSAKPQFIQAGSWVWDAAGKNLTLNFKPDGPSMLLHVSDQTDQTFVATENGKEYLLTRKNP